MQAASYKNTMGRRGLKGKYKGFAQNQFAKVCFLLLYVLSLTESYKAGAGDELIRLSVERLSCWSSRLMFRADVFELYADVYERAESGQSGNRTRCAWCVGRSQGGSLWKTQEQGCSTDRGWGRQDRGQVLRSEICEKRHTGGRLVYTISFCAELSLSGEIVLIL